MCTYICVHEYAQICVYEYAHIYIYICICIYMCVCVCVYTNMCTDSLTHIIHAHICIHKLTHHSCNKNKACRGAWIVFFLWAILAPYLAPVLFPLETQEDEVHFFTTADGARINLSRYRAANSTGILINVSLSH
jgi:hypothetical protein